MGDALMSAEGLRPFIANWQEVSHYFLRGVQADAQADGAPETLALLNRLLALPDVAGLSDGPPPADTQAPVLPIHFRRGDTSLCLFTTIATLGTPRDVTFRRFASKAFSRWTIGRPGFAANGPATDKLFWHTHRTCARQAALSR
jgi:hypothetical protein